MSIYKFGKYFIPERMMGGIERYVEHHIPPGDFLTAVFENNLSAACGRADDENMDNLPAYAAYLYNEVPNGCHGSPEKVQWWLDRKNRETLINTDAVEQAEIANAKGRGE
jgi:hypothetical protein